MKNEIEKIIAMVQEGKLSTDEASELINALKEETTNEADSDLSLDATNQAGQTLKVRIHSEEHEDININLPIKIIKSLLKMGVDLTKKIPQFQTYDTEIDMDLLIHAIDNNMTGKIIDITSSNGDLIAIYIE